MRFQFADRVRLVIPRFLAAVALGLGMGAASDARQLTREETNLNFAHGVTVSSLHRIRSRPGAW